MEKQKYLVLIFISLILLSGCQNGSQLFADPTPTPTEFTLPPVEPLPGWSRFEGREMEIWLPDYYFGGDPLKDLNLITQFLTEYGEEGQRILLNAQKNKSRYNFFAFNTLLTPTGILPTVNIFSEVVSPATSMNGYMDSMTNFLSEGYLEITRDVGSVNGIETGTMVLQAPLPNGSGRELRFMMRGEPTEMWVISFTTTVDDLDAHIGDMQQAVRSFRSSSMLPQVEVQAPTQRAAFATDTPQGMLAFDDFSDPDSGWGISSNEKISYYYAEGTYHMFVFAPDTLVWSVFGEITDNVILEVDAWPAAGQPADSYSEMGFLCGYLDAQNFYYLTIRSDGHFGIFQMQANSEKFLYSDIWEQNPTIRVDGSPNRLRAECIQDQLRLFVNNELMGEVTAPGIVSGRWGLMGGSFAWKDAHFQFDNFVASQP